MSSPIYTFHTVIDHNDGNAYELDITYQIQRLGERDGMAGTLFHAEVVDIYPEINDRLFRELEDSVNEKATSHMEMLPEAPEWM